MLLPAATLVADHLVVNRVGVCGRSTEPARTADPATADVTADAPVGIAAITARGASTSVAVAVATAVRRRPPLREGRTRGNADMLDWSSVPETGATPRYRHLGGPA
jgi:hypothetical protein